MAPPRIGSRSTLPTRSAPIRRPVCAGGMPLPCSNMSFDQERLAFELTLAARMALAALLGFLVGLEREASGKSAGERTFAIVALAASGFASTAITMFPDTTGQAVAGVATGIGFLGVGIIWRAGEGQTHGLTTEASILGVAAIGIVSGLGLYLT